MPAPAIVEALTSLAPDPLLTMKLLPFALNVTLPRPLSVVLPMMASPVLWVVAFSVILPAFLNWPPTARAAASATSIVPAFELEPALSVMVNVPWAIASVAVLTVVRVLIGAAGGARYRVSPGSGNKHIVAGSRDVARNPIPRGCEEAIDGGFPMNRGHLLLPCTAVPPEFCTKRVTFP